MSANATTMPRELEASRPWLVARVARALLADLVAAVLGAAIVLGGVGSCGNGCSEARAAELQHTTGRR